MKRTYVFVFALAVLCMRGSLNGQTPVRFTGFARAELQYDGITGNPQGRPRWIQTLYFDPALSIGNKPLSLRFAISSLESCLRQPFNRFSLRYQWKWGDVWAGDAYPVLSALTLEGQVVRGGSIDLKPGIFRLQLIAGKTHRGIAPNLPQTYPAFDQYLYGAAIGVGKEDSSAVFFKINALYGKDDYQDKYAGLYVSPVRPDSVIRLNKPRENMVAGINAGLNLFKKSLSIRGEITGSHLTRDSRAKRVDSLGSFRPPEFVGLRLSSQIDLAYLASVRFQRKDTKLEAAYKRVGDAYRSFGVPYLLYGLDNLSLNAQQRLFKKRLLLDLRWLSWQNNLSKQGPATNRLNTWMFNCGLTLPKGPTLTLGYLLGIQDNTAGSDTINFQRHNTALNAGIGYAFRKGRQSHAFNLHAAHYRFRFLAYSREADSLGLGNTTLNLSARHQVFKPLAFGWTALFIGNKAGAGRSDSRIWGGRAQVAGSFWKQKLTASAQFAWNRQTGTGIKKEKWNFGGSLGWRIHSKLEWGLHTDRNVFGNAGFLHENYKELLIRTFLNARW